MEKMKHTKGPFAVAHVGSKYRPTQLYAKPCGESVKVLGGYCDNGLSDLERVGNAELSRLMDTAPHLCSDPQCLGDINRRKLEAAEEMGKALKAIAAMRFKGKKLECSYFAEEALDTWDKAGKGKP